MNLNKKKIQCFILQLLLPFIGVSSYHSVYGWKTFGSQKRPSWLKEQRKWWELWSHYYCFCRQHFGEGLRHAYTAASSSKYSGLLVKFHPWLMSKVMTHKQCIETKSRAVPIHWNSSPLCLNLVVEYAAVLHYRYLEIQTYLIFSRVHPSHWEKWWRFCNVLNIK